MRLALALPLIASLGAAHARDFGIQPSAFKENRPLLIALHGWGGSGASLLRDWKLDTLAEEQGWLLAAPDGTTDPKGMRFWNAGEACCNFHRLAVDDLAFLGALIAETVAKHGADPKRVYVLGFSNGGFMAHRLACAMPGKVAAIVAVAGVATGECPAAAKVSVLQVHGDADRTIPFEGGRLSTGARFPSAQQTVEAWAKRNGCGAKPDAPRTIDVEDAVKGAETTVHRREGCPVELWKMSGVGHGPRFGKRWRAALVEHLANRRAED